MHLVARICGIVVSVTWSSQIDCTVLRGLNTLVIDYTLSLFRTADLKWCGTISYALAPRSSSSYLRIAEAVQFCTAVFCILMLDSIIQIYPSISEMQSVTDCISVTASGGMVPCLT